MRYLGIVEGGSEDMRGSMLLFFQLTRFIIMYFIINLFAFRSSSGGIISDHLQYVFHTANAR